MKKIFIPIIVLLFSACQYPGRHGDGKAENFKNDTDNIVQQPVEKAEEITKVDPVFNIRRKVEHINTKYLKTSHTEFVCDEQMKVDRFYDKGELVKITVDFGIVGDIYAREDYYYDKGSLIFKYEFTEGGPACEGCIKKNEYRSYINNDRVIKYLKDQRSEKCRNCSFEKNSRYYQLLKANTDQQIKAIFCR